MAACSILPAAARLADAADALTNQPANDPSPQMTLLARWTGYDMAMLLLAAALWPIALAELTGSIGFHLTVTSDRTERRQNRFWRKKQIDTQPAPKTRLNLSLAAQLPPPSNGLRLRHDQLSTIIHIARYRAPPYTVLMQHRKTISLTAKDDAFITGQLETGEYGNASEVIRAGLRLLEQEQVKLAALRQAISEGDADIAAGRTRAYQPGQLGDRLKKHLSKKTR